MRMMAGTDKEKKILYIHRAKTHYGGDDIICL